jgi:copper(I)-binding protein
VRAQPSATGMSVLYGTLVNESDRDWAITRALCERVRRPEIHETVMENDMARMRRVPELRIAKGQQVELRPGGLHLMLMGLEAPLQPGEYVYCTFLAGDVVVARDRGVVRAP